MIELQNMCLLFPKGIIKTALPDMSRENREQYQVVIQAKDMGGQMGRTFWDHHSQHHSDRCQQQSSSISPE